MEFTARVAFIDDKVEQLTEDITPKHSAQFKRTLAQLLNLMREEDPAFVNKLLADAGGSI